MSSDKSLFVASICAAASFALVWKWRRNRDRPPRPPGPKGYPIIGNSLDMPRDIPIWQAFMPMAQRFGRCRSRFFLENAQLNVLSNQDTDILYIKLMTTDFVVLNSTEAITDLIEKRSSIYSDRVSPSSMYNPSPY